MAAFLIHHHDIGPPQNRSHIIRNGYFGDATSRLRSGYASATFAIIARSASHSYGEYCGLRCCATETRKGILVPIVRIGCRLVF